MKPSVHEHFSLKPYNTFDIDVSAHYFVTIEHIDALKIILATHPHLPKFMLGGGSNVLFTRDIDGLVIHNQIKGIEKIDENNEHVFLKIGAGENWHQLVLYCINNNYAGIENLSLIPGTVGAAPIQNIGAYGVELKDVLHEVHAVSLSDLSIRVFDNAACEFGYRDSIFKNALKNKYMITQVILRLNKNPVFHVAYGAIREKLAGKPISIQSISDAVIAIRQEKLPDPKIIPNAGSFFKNPLVSNEKLIALQQKHPNIPHFPESNNRAKIPAGWLIEQCGFKGKRFGNTGVHAQQALVLVNNGNATGAEIKALAEHIQKTVRETFDIVLVTEVNIY